VTQEFRRVANRFDAIVVGAGPAGSTAAYHLARAGRRVLIVEKSRFPREKVCGDGLTPRAVRQLVDMGIDTSGPEWARTKGLRILGAGHRLDLTWPEISDMPGYGLVMTRLNFDELLLDAARKAGAEVWEETEVTKPLLGDGDVVTGVEWAHVENGETGQATAPVTIAGDGVANRFGLALGVKRLERRPMGVAVRTYYRSPRSSDDFFESYLELWSGDDLLPGYGWIFPLPDGTVNVGLGLLNTSKHFQAVNYKKLLRDWVANLPPEWEMTPETQIGKVRGASLPMGFNRAPVARPGLMLVGDAAGAVNPFNGEGIAYAMETAVIAAEVANDALDRGGDPYALRAYPERLKDEYEGYFIMGRAFVRLIGKAPVMGFLTKHGLKREGLMRFAFKILANLTEPRGGDAMDRVINGLERIAPALNTVIRIP
jgi:geranylgeranyl reductase family protein